MPKTKGTRAAKRVKDAKVTDFIETMNAGRRILGEIITWKVGGDDAPPHKFEDVVAALDRCGLNKDVAKELLPRHAFGRAAKKLMTDGIIDMVNEDADELKFQLTQKVLQSEQMRFDVSGFLELNKTTGKITCADEKLRELAQRLVQEATETRTSNDITKIIQRLFEDHSDLMPFREQGGVYIVPAEHVAFVDKIRAFLETLGGKLRRARLSAGDKEDERSMGEVIDDYITNMISELNVAVEGFGIDTRADTIERAAKRVKDNKVKIEAYKHYMTKEIAKKLDSALEESDKKLEDRIKEISETKSKVPARKEGETGPTRGGTLFGVKATAIIRWMASKKWSKKEIKRVMASYEIKVKTKTVDCQYDYKKRGPVPELSKDREHELNERRATAE